MVSMGSHINFKGLDAWFSGMTPRMKKEVSLGVRDQLALIERRHKRKEIKSGGRGNPVGRTWTSRTRELSRSFHRDWKQGSLKGAYGSDKRRARTIEDGGEIRAKGKYLAIPLDKAPRANNKPVGPRDVEGLFFITSKKGNNLLVKSEGGGIIPMYALKRSVKLPPRPALDRAVKATEKPREAVMLKHVDKALGGK